MEPVLRRAFRGPCALPPGSRLLVAVSGGADSTALLLALSSLQRELSLELAAAHLHHGLRGADADADLEHVRALCTRLHVPLTAAHWDTRVRMARRKLSGQAGLRTLRREFLIAAQLSANAAAIATAHTADDQMETVLMRLLRGAGLPGLGGMSARAGEWIKPLLEATRADIETDLKNVGQAWRDDASNGDLHYLRNRVRHAVVPALIEARHPGAARDDRTARASLARGVAASARELRDAEQALAERARRLLTRHGGTSDTRAWIARAPLEAAPRAVRLSALRELWNASGRGAVGLTRRHLAALLSLSASGEMSERVELPDGRVATCRDSRIEIALAADVTPPEARPRRGRAVAARAVVAPAAGRARREDAKLTRPRAGGSTGVTGASAGAKGPPRRSTASLKRGR